MFAGKLTYFKENVDMVIININDHRMQTERVTQKDVALAAGISQSLVSVVLNRSDSQRGVRVSEETRQRVIEAAERLGYLQRQKPPTFGRKILVYLQPSQPLGEGSSMPSRLLSEMVEAVAKRDLALTVRFYDPGHLPPVMEWLERVNAEGVFLHAFSDDSALAEWIVERFPLVQLNRKVVPRADLAMCNHEEAAAGALAYLAKAGHERVALGGFGGEDSISRLYLRTYREFYDSRRGAAADKFLKARTADDFLRIWEQSGGDRPTAVLATERWGLELSQIAALRGIALGRDLVVVCVNQSGTDLLPLPSLPCIDVRLDEIARVAASLMVTRMKNRSAAFQKVEITPRLLTHERQGAFAAPEGKGSSVVADQN